MATDADRIGKTWTIEPPAHVGHTLTVEGRDAVEKHGAFWVVCSCGARTTIGESHVDRAIADAWSPYDHEDERFRP